MITLLHDENKNDVDYLFTNMFYIRTMQLMYDQDTSLVLPTELIKSSIVFVTLPFQQSLKECFNTWKADWMQTISTKIQNDNVDNIKHNMPKYIYCETDRVSILSKYEKFKGMVKTMPSIDIDEQIEIYGSIYIPVLINMYNPEYNEGDGYYSGIYYREISWYSINEKIVQRETDYDDNREKFVCSVLLKKI